VREYDRQYKADHAEEERERKHARRAREISAPGTHTAADLRLQARAQTDKRGRLICWWCGKPIKGTYHADHRIPLDRGGSNWPENIVIAHAKCNLSKGTKLPGEFNGRLL
jgi:5-methylcytosine-specific restriction endonuclease McrA